MHDADLAFAPFADRMHAEGLPDLAIRTFRQYYKQLQSGHTGLIPEADILPVADLPDVDDLGAEAEAAGAAAMAQTFILKLNGGLGTSMGLAGPKSLLPVKAGLSFLDIIARQALHWEVPLVLMNSFSTRTASLNALAAYPDLQRFSVPLDFVQHKVPKIRQDDLTPADWPSDPALTWCPPGHGDLYTALRTSGMLSALRAQGYRYAFVSNADNLGAVLNPEILGFLVQHRLPFLMEVTDRLLIDRKGGHLARRRSDGQLILRETAQCPPEDADAFIDVVRHRYANTNNLWIDLEALEAVLTVREGLMTLPMIRNPKTVDPRDPASTPVYQLETAMGTAISVFPSAGAIRVPRLRFSPVKTTGDLLAVRSDAYVMTDDFRVRLHPSRTRAVQVFLDSRYYKLIDQLEARTPAGPPSLVACDRLTVEGDVAFGAEITVRGEAVVVNTGAQPAVLPDGAVVEGRQELG